jgi:hypothetical protein
VCHEGISEDIASRTSIYRSSEFFWVISWPHAWILSACCLYTGSDRLRKWKRGPTMINGCAAALTKLRKNANSRAGLGISLSLTMNAFSTNMQPTFSTTPLACNNPSRNSSTWIPAFRGDIRQPSN